MTVFGALGFMALGGVIVGFFNWRAWCMYQRGKGEMREMRRYPKNENR